MPYTSDDTAAARYHSDDVLSVAVVGPVTVLLSGAFAAAATAAATATVTIMLAMGSSGAGSSDATLTVERPLAGSFTGSATAVCSITGEAALSGAFAGAATTTAALSVSHPLTMAATGAGTATATLSIAHPLTLSATGAATATATLEAENTLHMRVFSFLLSPDTTATVGMTNDNTLVAEYPGTVTKVIVSAPEAYKPDGADFIVKVSFGGTEIGTALQRARILDSTAAVDGVVYGLYETFDTPTFLEGDVVEVEVMQVGSTYAGRMITVQVVTLEDVS